MCWSRRCAASAPDDACRLLHQVRDVLVSPSASASTTPLPALASASLIDSDTVLNAVLGSVEALVGTLRENGAAGSDDVLGAALSLLVGVVCHGRSLPDVLKCIRLLFHLHKDGRNVPLTGVHSLLRYACRAVGVLLRRPVQEGNGGCALCLAVSPLTARCSLLLTVTAIACKR